MYQSEYEDLCCNRYSLNIPKSSLHDTLARLVKEGFVKNVILDKSHKQADGYRITMKGHIYFNELNEKKKDHKFELTNF